MDGAERQRAFDQWIARHKGLMLKVVRAYARTPHDQDDLFQEVAFQLWNSLPPHEGVAPSTWTYRVAMYTAIGWSRKEKNRQRHSESLGGDEHLLPQPAESTDARVEWLYEQIGRLGEVDRSLAVLMLDGCSYKEMADVLGISESYVGVKISRIKKRLSQQLRRGEDHGL